MKNPWMKFYPIDWRADPRLRMCSLSARGLWIDLMAYMHEGEPYGHLTVDGAVPDLAAIALLVGRPDDEVTAALAELEARKVISRAANSVIYSRRMVRDFEKSQIGRREAEKRWGPNGSPIGSPIGSPNAKKPYPESRKVNGELFEDDGRKTSNGRGPPSHGMRSRDYGTIFIENGTDEWTMYAKDFEDVRSAQPIPNRYNGFWFMQAGEQSRPPPKRHSQQRKRG